MTTTKWFLPLDVDDRQFDVCMGEPGDYIWHPTPTQTLDCRWLQQNLPAFGHSPFVIPQGFMIVSITEAPRFFTIRRFSKRRFETQILNRFIEEGENWRCAISESQPKYRADHVWIQTHSFVAIQINADSEIQTHHGTRYVDKLHLSPTATKLFVNRVDDVVDLVLEAVPYFETDVNMHFDLVLWLGQKSPAWRQDCIRQLLLHDTFRTMVYSKGIFPFWLPIIIGCNCQDLVEMFLQQVMVKGQTLSDAVDIALIDIEVLECVMRYGYRPSHNHLLQMLLTYDPVKISWSHENLGLVLDSGWRNQLVIRMLSQTRNASARLDGVFDIWSRFQDEWTQPEIKTFFNIALLANSEPLMNLVLSRWDIADINQHLENLVTVTETWLLEPYLLADMVWYTELDMIQRLLNAGITFPRDTVEFSLAYYWKSRDPSFAVVDYLIEQQYCDFKIERRILYWCIRHDFGHIMEKYGFADVTAVTYSTYAEAIALAVGWKNRSYLEMLAQGLAKLQREDLVESFKQDIVLWQKRFPYRGKYAVFLQHIVDADLMTCHSADFDTCSG